MYLVLHTSCICTSTWKDVREHEAHRSATACRRLAAASRVACFAGRFDRLNILHVHVVYNIEAHPSCDVH